MSKNDPQVKSLRTNKISEAAVAGVEGGVFYHDPVMLKECLEGLRLEGAEILAGGTFADCTLGGGGHSYAIATRLSAEGTLHSFDRDDDAVKFATKRLSAVSNGEGLPKFVVHPVPFAMLGEEIPADSLDGVLYDLGISSHQVDDSTRGFTFVGNNPLDLRMDRREEVSAQEWLRSVSADDLAEALRKNADMDRAFKLATRIIEVATETGREGRDILPSDIKSVVESVFPDKRRDANSLLARVFQAVRMEVNGELRQIETSIRSAVDCLKVGGRLVVMSYHSVEDRCVKDTCAEFEKACICPEHLPVCMCGGNHQRLKKVNRKPILPSNDEIAKNSRARSAKLRVYERV
ncbi:MULTISPECIES: 16S rRNA (cytosine(1402)-N(4))-methyltransferase RsmH [unclassified Fibrobacter]|uniref:16S rRNA (cytosine(1402)-N(4))-methyltransferase RsmH n=1 Tax=unclassified Fibrobacter TaxID=2634177 RepID=UPI0009155E6E|nr:MULTISPECIES: 16S rRNA (cytosine(1402)-N(4))-methyltransferase RsmH [unclassified Fibrobacter]OWV07663.1 16S rRNA (cytosine(1402)-N(4))-methyltransferase [Fibrobacter sp. UWH3]SHK55870.1 16S rRNA (cytosine1402-N4)-methyltransferase [Fibrobacter sp. UWH6]SHK59397.1 16S rRNA (cytosine1402-N4)-methyltransferase [Fibrobacter sp. UWH5]